MDAARRQTGRAHSTNDVPVMSHTPDRCPTPAHPFSPSGGVRWPVDTDRREFELAKNASDTAAVRLRAALEVLAEAQRVGDTPKSAAVLTAAAERVPFDAHEAHLLSGGVPRGQKALTAATTKAVKAGWMTKGRVGWSITETGLRALAAFPSADALADALAAGTPIPAAEPVAVEPEAAPEPVVPVAETLAAEPVAEIPVSEPVTETPAEEPVAAIAEEPVVAIAETSAEEPVTETPAAPIAVAGVDQPHAVAIAGDFGARLGAEADWEPSLDAVQMDLDGTAARWHRTVELPAGTYSFKIAINRSWNENYGAFGYPDGANHELFHSGGTVTIEYDHGRRDVAFV